MIKRIGLYEFQKTKLKDIKDKYLLKRVNKLTSIGVTIVHNPSLIILEDPTYDLDS